jgi:hypothetical protein
MRALYLLFAVIITNIIFSSIGWSTCEGDLNCDGVTDGTDLAIFANDFGTTGCGNCDDVIARIQDLENRVTQLEALLQNVTRIGNTIIFEAVNLQIVNGTGFTDSTLNSVGNLIVGYNEARTAGNVRNGSHNIILGTHNNYSAFGGIVAGYWNTISGPYASIVGGTNNTASGSYSSVSGGRVNGASGEATSVNGGAGNEAIGEAASVSGGLGNTASGDYSSVSGGRDNEVSGDYSSISGGRVNDANGIYSSVSGGYVNTADSNYTSVSGGYDNNAFEIYSSVSGGYGNVASGQYASVTGGSGNTASGSASSVSGGAGRSVSGTYNWRAGFLFEEY